MNKEAIVCFVREFLDGDTLAVAGELTYKLMLSLFPLLLFLLSLMAYFDLDITLLDELIRPYLPEGIHALFLDFINERTQDRNVAILSFSLLLALVSSSSGFRAMMRGISRTHGIKDTRAYYKRILISLGMTLIFCVAIISAMIVIVLRNALPFAIIIPSHTFAYSVAAIMMTLSVVLIYRFSVPICTTLSVVPGAILTVALWLASSHIFNIYFANFSSHSLMYGSIANAFVLLIWLNAVSVIILVGAQLNATLATKKEA